ncbi:MAG: ABC transporter ATP-binding protein [Muribaculaceae bacterium]|nr:ABC transporter ATP-binding protein [Muribaculaceae bacterium]
MIEAVDITRSFGDLTVLHGLSLSIAPAEVVSIVGPSGAGKSTLLQILGTLDRPTSGKVTYDSVDVASLSDRELSRFRNQNIGFIFQAHRLLPEFSLLENVMLPALIARMPRREAAEQARRLLDYLGLSHRLDHRPTHLSGGECQRGSVARALINSPKVIFADEPTGALDSANRRELQQLLLDLRRDFGQTIVIVTHDESLAAAADRTITLLDGRIS